MEDDSNLCPECKSMKPPHKIKLVKLDQDACMHVLLVDLWNRSPNKDELPFNKWCLKNGLGKEIK
jgi:hypothetical protein